MSTASLKANTLGSPRVSVPTWVLIVIIWHMVCGAVLVLLAAAFALPSVVGSIIGQPAIESLLVYAPTDLARIVLAAILGIVGVALLADIPGLRAYRSRARIISLGINFVALILSGFYVFRQLTVNSDVASTELPIRLGMALPGVPLILAFGVVCYALWRKDVSYAYGETQTQREALTAYMYISPYLAIASIFMILLLGYAFFLSFHEFHQFDTPVFNGLKNYQDVFKDRLFNISLSNIFWYAIIVVILQTICALMLAMLMNGNFALRRVFRTIFYMPSVTSSVVISLIFLWLFNGRGFVNQFLINTLHLRDFFVSAGIRTPPAAIGGPNWLNIADRLGQLTWLKPFYAGNGPLVIGVLIALVILFVAMRYVRNTFENRGEYAPVPVRVLNEIGNSFVIGVLIALVIYCILIQLSLPTLQSSNQGEKDQFGMLMLQGPSIAFMVIMLMNVFTTSPTFMIMFLAALQDIPAQLYEAAQIDGANGWGRFRYVTLPMLRPVMLLVVVLGTIGTFQVFDQIKVMTAGSPLDTTTTPVYLIYTKALGSAQVADVGYASAMAFILGAIIFVFTFIQRQYIERGTSQY
jgi:multiple sugar transport system permease protein